MTNHLEKLVIFYRWPIFFARYWPFLVFLTVIMNFYPSPNWIDAVGLLLSGVFSLALVLQGVSRRYVVIDRSGILCALWTSGRAWSQFEACAYKNEDTQRILRIFYRRATESTTPTVDWQDAAPRVEIDFSDTTNPEQSVEKAFQACANWIAATGAPHPIRPFVDGPSLKRPTFWAPKTEFIFQSLIILFIPYLILLQHMRE